SPLQDDHDLDEDEQALARNLPPVSTSRSRSNIILSDDDHQEGESKSILLCWCRLLGNLVDLQVLMTCMISLINQKRK
ncbi:MAG TPA: hypothetical protein VHT52_12485, partial [Stellaceae bacterium]|nr:hypothetical protein [Stellaceae bacterium]